VFKKLRLVVKRPFANDVAVATVMSNSVAAKQTLSLKSNSVHSQEVRL
jgi:hypothetical protein